MRRMQILISTGGVIFNCNVNETPMCISSGGWILCSHNFFSGTFCFTYCMQSSRCTSYHGVVEKRFQCFCQFLIAISCDPAFNFIVHIIATSSSSFDTVPNSLIYYQNSLHHFPSYHVGKHSHRFATAHKHIGN